MSRWVGQLFGILAGIALVESAVTYYSAPLVGVAVLAALGGVLTLGGLGWGLRGLTREYRGLVADLDAIVEITGRTDLGDAEKERMRNGVRQPSSAYLDVLYLREWIRRRVLEQAVDNLRFPALFTTAGTVCATFASVWSVWL